MGYRNVSRHTQQMVSLEEAATFAHLAFLNVLPDWPVDWLNPAFAIYPSSPHILVFCLRLFSRLSWISLIDLIVMRASVCFLATAEPTDLIIIVNLPEL